ncbi:MAG: hypothetical protein M1834_004004 [Cirrosporium novae-zelandiae]|nr:MAG: hypothetical protein M1834_004004 [Cirrosporium novae-zelandiae]
MEPEQDAISLKWSTQLHVSSSSKRSKLVGDKICLPPSALEALLSAATVTVSAPEASQPYSRTFDPYNPHSFAAEREAREQALERQQRLPHPLTFRLVNPKNDRVAYAGIREFSAEEDEIILSEFLQEALGLRDEAPEDSIVTESTKSRATSEDPPMNDGAGHKEGPLITVHSRQLPKGTFVRLRPLEAGYDPEDWKALLEQYMRDNFTTLANGEVLRVRGRGEDFQFLIDKLSPESEAICIIDTDLEVDIEALNEEQARETLKRRLEKSQKAPGTKDGSSKGGELVLGEVKGGQVLQGEYVDYEVRGWEKDQDIVIKVDAAGDSGIDIFVSPLSRTQRANPRIDQHVFADFNTRPSKRMRISHKNSELDGAEALWISVHSYQNESVQADKDSEKRLPLTFSLLVDAYDENEATGSVSADDDEHTPDEEQCKNCHQWVPKRTMVLHENFCYRNNILCPHCQNVFQKRSEEWKNHWHCPHDSSYGNSLASKSKHDQIFHGTQTCPTCSYQSPNLPSLAHHRTTTCPGKTILCQFCHLLVPQQGDGDLDAHDPEVILSGLTPHEYADGARTTECHLCNKITRLRDMDTHLKFHTLQKLNKPKPRVCRNRNCGRVIDEVSESGDVKLNYEADLDLCKICYGPLYVSMHDPTGKALKRRIERRYLGQLLTGCRNSWCRNEFCKSGRANMGVDLEGTTISTKNALPMIKPFVDGVTGTQMPLHFCVDEASQQRRDLAELLAAEGSQDEKGKGKLQDDDASADSYDFEWCVAALEVEGNDLNKARTWLQNWAPSRKEVTPKSTPWWQDDREHSGRQYINERIDSLKRECYKTVPPKRSINHEVLLLYSHQTLTKEESSAKQLTMKHLTITPNPPKPPLLTSIKPFPSPPQPKWAISSSTQPNASIYFIGTATTLLSFPPLTILTDPNFVHSGSLVRPGPGTTSKRLSDPSIPLEELPPIDLVLLSTYCENHFDGLVEERLSKEVPILTTGVGKRELEGEEKGFRAVMGVGAWESVMVQVEEEEGIVDGGWRKVVKVTAMPAEHMPSGGLLGKVNDAFGVVPPSTGWMVELGSKEIKASDESFECGYRIYITGDTFLDSKLNEISLNYTQQNKPINLMLLHLGGTSIPSAILSLLMITMDAKQGLGLMEMIKPNVTIPIHFDDYDIFLSPLEDFKKLVRDAGLEERVVYLNRGDEYQFNIKSRETIINGN